MTGDANISYQVGFREEQLKDAAQLYDGAFGPKLTVAIRAKAERLALLERTFVPEFAISASSGTTLVGLAGFHTPEGSLTGGMDAHALLGQLGMIRGLWAIAILALYERKPRPGELLMDGIAVDSEHRGHGIGSELLRRLVDYARDAGYQSIRLDVIDTNPGARRLYERVGFVATGTERYPFLRPLLGFGGSTTMELHVDGPG